MYCSRCGASVPENVAFCGHCGQPTGPVPPEPIGASPVPAPVFSAPGAAITAPPLTPTAPVAATFAPEAVPSTSPYAGFWLRFVAYVIDAAIVTVGLGVFVAAGALFLGAGFLRNLGDLNSNDNLAPLIAVPFVLMLICATLAASWLYYAWFESSRHQGTLGKMALGLMVTDMQGRRVTFARASGRFFAKIITGLIPLFIGYIMAGFTQRKQALHDMIASCLVLRRL